MLSQGFPTTIKAACRGAKSPGEGKADPPFFLKTQQIFFNKFFKTWLHKPILPNTW
jgi:hypothetical protein